MSEPVTEPDGTLVVAAAVTIPVRTPSSRQQDQVPALASLERVPRTTTVYDRVGR
ncbi:hypothetical protein ABTZ93_13535 [Streptomyces sp. NPDC097941]|uniref:hypothetical protein n=1 Tax=Streptomyces sp. NPDC097941 TaxID=3155685 RepID=UPI003331F34E